MKKGMARLEGFTFFEFNDPYYALIKAKDSEEALNIFIKEVAGTEEERNEFKPTVISHFSAIGKIYNSYYIEHPDIEIEETLEEYLEYFLKEESNLILLDGSLL